MKQCSELFAEVFDSHGGGIVRTCACGVTTFCVTDPGFFDKGELERLLEQRDAFPERYHAVDYTVTTMEIGGEEIVTGCTCDRARKYEAFIEANATRLAEYLRRYAAALREQANRVDVPSEVQPAAVEQVVRDRGGAR